MPFRAEKAGNRPKAAIKRTRRPNYTTPIFSMSDREQDFYRFLKNPPPLRGVGVSDALGVDTYRRPTVPHAVGLDTVLRSAGGFLQH